MMAHSVSKVQSGRTGLKGYHVLLWLTGFFGMMFVVNGIFLFYAIKTFPGEDVKKSYVQGLDYNRTLAQRAAQSELGWHAEIGMNGPHLEIRIIDSAGAGVSGHEVRVLVRRLATTSDDRELLTMPQGGGVYMADVSALAPGQWEIIADVNEPDGGATLFEARKRVTKK